MDGALISVGGSPPGTMATTTDDAWRSAFESVFLGAVRLARILAADLSGRGGASADARSVTGADASSVTGADARSVTGAGGSIVFVLASSVRVPLADIAISNGLFPGFAAWSGWPANWARPGFGSTGCCRSGSPPTVRELDALRGDPDEVPALVQHIPLRRYGEPEEFGGWPRSCSLQPRPP